MKITKVYGPDTATDGEQVFWSVGYNCTEITEREDNFGTYGIRWFVIASNEAGTVELNALHVFGVERVPAE